MHSIWRCISPKFRINLKRNSFSGFWRWVQSMMNYCNRCLWRALAQKVVPSPCRQRLCCSSCSRGRRRSGKQQQQQCCCSCRVSAADCRHVRAAVAAAAANASACKYILLTLVFLFFSFFPAISYLAPQWEKHQRARWETTEKFIISLISQWILTRLPAAPWMFFSLKRLKSTTDCEKKNHYEQTLYRPHWSAHRVFVEEESNTRVLARN